MRVTNGIPLGVFTLLWVATVNSFQTRKALHAMANQSLTMNFVTSHIHERLCVRGLTTEAHETNLGSCTEDTTTPSNSVDASAETKSKNVAVIVVLVILLLFAIIGAVVFCLCCGGVAACQHRSNAGAKARKASAYMPASFENPTYQLPPDAAAGRPADNAGNIVSNPALAAQPMTAPRVLTLTGSGGGGSVDGAAASQPRPVSHLYEEPSTVSLGASILPTDNGHQC
jgi:hypothetical protein